MTIPLNCSELGRFVKETVKDKNVILNDGYCPVHTRIDASEVKMLKDLDKTINGKNVAALGFFDSGNLAVKNGLPVCFVGADLFYEICGKEMLFEEKGMGQVRDEMQITTMTGIRKIPLFQGEIDVKTGARENVKKAVYFAPATNMIQREYKILLNARIFEV